MTKNSIHLASALLLCVFPLLSNADRRMEDPSYYDGMIAIRDMHGLNLLGIAGELVGIYNALYEASDAAEVLYGNKWRPGDDDLGWVDRPRQARAPSPLAGLRPRDRKRVRDIVGKIHYLQGLVDRWSPEEEKYEIREAIRIQYTRLNRIALDYRDEVLPTIPITRSPPRDRNPQCRVSPDVAPLEQATIYSAGNPRMGYSVADVCWSSRQAHDAERKGDYVKSTKKPCNRCPSGYQRATHNGVEACFRCPKGTRLGSGCCN